MAPSAVGLLACVDGTRIAYDVTLSTIDSEAFVTEAPDTTRISGGLRQWPSRQIEFGSAGGDLQDDQAARDFIRTHLAIADPA